jgi:hypothetical protein
VLSRKLSLNLLAYPEIRRMVLPMQEVSRCDRITTLANDRNFFIG